MSSFLNNQLINIEQFASMDAAYTFPKDLFTQSYTSILT